MQSMRRFEGKTAVITGGGGEIGRAMGRRLGAEGARVFVVDRDEAAIDRTVTALAEHDVEADGTVADVTVAADVARYADEGARFGGGTIDLFCNNAGIEGPIASLKELDEDAFDQTIAVNLKGAFLGFKYVLPHMRDGGAIVVTASIGAVTGTAGFAAYQASKHGVLGLMRSAAKEAIADGIRVNAVLPASVDSRMLTSIESVFDEATVAGFRAATPIGRKARPDEIASATAYLLSDDASYVVGNAHLVDGGWTA